jgi:uncharacterized membrane protein YhaH (DUF805 family)
MHELALLLQSQPDPEMIRKLIMTMAMIIPIIILIAIIVVMIPCWIILKKAGFSQWLALLCVVPSLGTLVLLYMLAFADWKVVPAPQPGWMPQPPYPPQNPLPPQAPPPQA